MEDSRFDRLSRLLARSLHRRAGLRGLAAAAVAAAVAGNVSPAEAAPSAENCLPVGRRCGKNSGNRGGPCKKCCSRLTSTNARGTRRCTCRLDGTACGNSSQCCNGLCSPETGTCGGLAPLCTPLGEVCPSSSTVCCDDAVCGAPNVISAASRTPRGVAFVCCRDAGGACTADTDCCANFFCGKGTCLPT